MFELCHLTDGHWEGKSSLWVTTLGMGEQLMRRVGIFVWPHSKLRSEYFNYPFVTFSSSSWEKTAAAHILNLKSKAVWIMKMEEEVWETHNERV